MSKTWEGIYARHLWRVGPNDFNGRKQIEIWPHYRDQEGVWRHGRGGLQFPVEEAGAVAAAILAAAAQLR